MKKAQGGDHGNQYVANPQIEGLPTADRLAIEHGVSRATVERAGQFAGEMLAQMRKATGTRGQLAGGTSRVPPENAPTLAAMDISKNESSRWQKLAAIPEDREAWGLAQELPANRP